MCIKLSICFFAASITYGLQCPTFDTAIPEVKSMNLFPSTSSKTAPFPLFIAIGSCFPERNSVANPYFSSFFLSFREFFAGGSFIILGISSFMIQSFHCDIKIFLFFEYQERFFTEKLKYVITIYFNNH